MCGFVFGGEMRGEMGMRRGWWQRTGLRREEPPIACQDCDGNIIPFSNLAHQGCDAVIMVLSESIELLGKIESDNGDSAAGLVQNSLFNVGVGGHDCVYWATTAS